MALYLIDTDGNYEKVTDAKFMDLPVKLDFAAGAPSQATPIRLILEAGVATHDETYSLFAGFPATLARRLYTQRNTNDGVTVFGSHTITSATMNFTSADLGRTISVFTAATPDSNLGLGTTIVHINSATSIEVAGTPGSTGTVTGRSISIANRTHRSTFDLGAGGYSETVYGKHGVQAETDTQTGDYWVANNAYAQRHKGIPIAAASAAGDIMTKSETDGAYPNVCQIEMYDAATSVANGNQMGRIRIPSSLNGFNLTTAGAMCDIAPTGSNIAIQVQRARKASPSTWVNMLTTPISMDATKVDSSDAGTTVAVDPTNRDVATGDRITFTVTGTYTAGSAKGLWVTTTWAKP